MSKWMLIPVILELLLTVATVEVAPSLLHAYNRRWKWSVRMSVDDNFVIQCGGNRPTQMKDQGPGGSMVLSGPGPIFYLRVRN
jgi:hypothetical protein